MNKSETFSHWCDAHWENGNICPPELDYIDTMDFLYEYLVSPYMSYITAIPINGKQFNVLVVDYILRKYSPLYRVEIGIGSWLDKFKVWLYKVCDK